MRSSWLLVVLAVACRHASEDEGEDKPAAAAVTCQPAAAAEIGDVVEVTGVIAPPPKVDAIVSSPVAGRVGQVAVEEGDHVEAGQMLATIEDPALPAGSIEAKAGVASAQAAKFAAEQDVARQQRLVDTGIGARKDLDEARARLAAANAELDAAKARSGLATTNLSRRELRAPRAGTVLHVWKKVGESVDGTAATPVVEIADLSVLELHAQVSPTMLAPLKEGMPASVRVLGRDTTVDAKVVRVAPAVDSTTLLGLVRLALASSDAVKVGTAATAQIVVSKRPGVRVPASALRRSLVGADEVVVCAGSIAEVRTVKVGVRSAQGVEILDGLKPDERVVVDHLLGLDDGQQLLPAGQGSAR
jgi:RND family efflux transporter MFP subunit